MNDNSFIYHFLMEKVEEGGVVTMPRIFTNAPMDSELERYNKSLVTHKPVDSLLALTTGTWHVWLLQKRLADLGHKFRIMILDNKEVKAMDPSTIAIYANKSTFCYANDSHTFFIRIEGAEWGLGSFGLRELDVPKVAKRFAELCRLTELAFYSNDDTDISMLVRAVDGDVKLYDGMNYISKRFALKMVKLIPNAKRRNRVRRAIDNGEMARFNIRVLGPLGLIKGDCIVVEHQVADVMYHPENLKPELATDGWIIATMTHHSPHHIAVWDSQTWINNRTMLPEQKHKNDVDMSIQSLRDSFAKGEVPEWLMLGEEMHDDSGLPDYERLSDLLDRNNVWWQAHGHDIKAISNAVYMATNGLVKRMKREYKAPPANSGQSGFYRKTWTQMSYAFLAGVITKESLANMGRLPVQGTPYMYFDPSYGLVMSGKRFADTYSLHGGWDLDDSVKVILIKVYSSSQLRTQTLLESGALDPQCAVPANVKDAVYAALLVRSPNGPGEYSIEALDQDAFADMPWHGAKDGIDDDKLPLVDLVDAPDPQPILLENVIIQDIPTSLTHTREPLTFEQCLAMIDAQRFNPGIGMICNCLMNWTMTMGTSFPPKMLALLEQMVDTTQQLRDPVSFKAISDEVSNLYDQMVQKVIAEDRKVDKLLSMAHPIPNTFANQMKKHMVEGRFTRFNKYFAQRVYQLEKEIRDNSLQMRNTTPLVLWARSINVSPTTLQWAKEFFERYSSEFKANDVFWSDSTEKMNPFAKMHFQQMRTNANKDTIARAVAELEAFGGDDTHKRVLSLWHYILKPAAKGRPLGHQDRLIFQPGQDKSIMHLLTDALAWMGQGNGFIAEGEED